MALHSSPVTQEAPAAPAYTLRHLPPPGLRMPWYRSAALTVVVLSVAAFGLVRPERLYVSKVEFEGHARAHEAELRHLSGVRNGATIWEVDVADVSASVLLHPWVSKVTTTRRLDGTVHVAVQEHDPVALLSHGGQLYYLDAGGRPFMRALTDDLDHPIISGLGPELEQVNPELPDLVVNDALWLMEQMHERGLVDRQQISEVRFSRTRGFTVQLAGSQPAARVLFGFGSYERQLDHLASLLHRGVDLSEPLHVDVAPRTVAIVRPIEA